MKSDLKKGYYYIADNNIIMYRHPTKELQLIVLPPEHRKAFLHYYHHHAGVHLKIEPMAEELIKHYYWPGYHADIKDYCDSCHSCQINKAVKSKRIGKQKLFTPTRPRQMLAVDHKGAINPGTVRGNLYVTNIYDRFSGKVWSYPVPSIDAKQTAITLMTHCMEYGVPQKILSDQGSDLISEVVMKLCKLLKVKKIQTGSYSPYSNGSVERYNRTMAAALRTIRMDRNLDFTGGDSWDLFVKYIATQHNNRYAKRIGMSPNECDLGYNVILPIDANTRWEYVDERHEGARFYNEYIRNLKKMTSEICRLRLDK